ncbi:MAG TPA: ABC transporter permease [Muribaculum sp.]|jgi:ABC-2 type transport system permease protein|uniref:ABC transporter permease n=2 Tax=Muribaculaceae TaxID=2005473 RepID=A0ABV4CWC5_9BACT|nr:MULTISPECIES: ABC transporter permease [Bacteroidales]RLT77959.1 ABC transporter permease [bacterium J10(2018)]HRF69248.1 ABC transporter permease [Muribaculum sp.]
MNNKSTYRRILAISRRELGIYSRRPLFLFCLLVAPVLCVVLFVTLMDDGLPTKLPTGIVDEDNTQISRVITRTIDALEETDIKYSYPDFTEARKAMQRGEIYAFFYIPRGTTEKAISNRQPQISFYTNDAYLLAGSLLMKDLKTASESTGMAITRENLYAHGLTETQAMGIIQPIVIESHPLNNPELDYSVYLNNVLLPGILILLITLATTYTIGLEWKQGTQKRLFAMAGNSSWIALIGKLLPQTLLFSLVFIFYDVYFYQFLRFPCNSGIFPMIMLGILTVLASQGFGVFLFGVFSGQMRLSMCICSLWGILSFSLAGFTYPVTSMAKWLEFFSWIFPLRQYYLIYVNQALNGYPASYVWTSVLTLVVFALLPVLVIRRYRTAFLKYKYKP